MSAAPLLAGAKAEREASKTSTIKQYTVDEVKSAALKLGPKRKVANMWQAFWNNKVWKEQYLELLARSKTLSLRVQSIQDELFEDRQERKADELAEKTRGLKMHQLKKGAMLPDESEDDASADEQDDEFQIEAEMETDKQAVLDVCQRIDRNIVQYQDLLHMSQAPFTKFVADYLRHRKHLFSSKAAELQLEDVEKLQRFTLKLEGMLEMCQQWVAANDQLQFKVVLLIVNALPIVYKSARPFVHPHLEPYLGNRTMI
jgi:hypothetical protein